MKKIVLTGTGFHSIPPVKGAAVETWIDEVAKKLTDKFQPFVISPYDPSRPVKETINGVTYYRIKIGKIYTRLFKKITKIDPYSYDKRIATVIKVIAPDIVHVHNRSNILDELNRVEFKNIKKILQIHNGEPKRIPQNIDAFTGCSKYTLNKWTENKKACKINEVIYNGVDTELFRPGWERLDKKEEMREKFNINSKNTIVTICRISPEKGLEYLIEAFKLTLKKIPDAKLVIVGEIRRGNRKNCEREEYGRKILNMIEEVKSNIILTDLVSPKEVQDYYLLGDIFALTSKEENFPFVILEAMASGLPVIASNVGGIKEAVKNGKNGILIDKPSHVQSIYNNILWLFENRHTMKNMAKAGRKQVEENFSWKKIAQQTANLYERLLT